MTALVSRAQLIGGGVCAALLLMLIYELTASPAVAELPPVPARQILAEAALPAARALPPLASFSAIDARPLFAPDRKALPPPEEQTATLAPPTQLSLIGVIIDKTHRLALIRSPSASIEVSVSVGESIEGWTVAAVEPDRVVLRSGGTDYALDLFAKRAPGSAPPIPSAPLAGPQPPGPAQPRPN